MPEYRSYLQGRRLIDIAEVNHRTAELLGELPPPLPPIPLWIRFLEWLRRIFGKPSRIPEVVMPPINPRFISWGGARLPEYEGTGHFLICGSPGSGKTLFIVEMMIRILLQFVLGGDNRALVYDAKREWYALLHSLGLKVPIYYVDPFDPRGWALDIGKEVRSRADAMQVAAALVPITKGDSDRFWTHSTRNILAAVIFTLAETTQGQFTFKDVLLAMRSRQRLAFLLNSRPDTAHLWCEANADEKTLANLMSTFQSHLQKYEVVAALWDQAPNRFSIRQWIEEGGILLIAGHPAYREALTPIHQLIFDLAADRLLNLPDSSTRRSWMFLDELRNLNRLPKLYHLANEGRSKGVALVLGFQSYEGIKDVYGENVANEIIGQIRNKIFLRTNSAATAEWVEKHFGQVDWLVESVTESSQHGRSGATSGTSVAHSRRRESVILASDIMRIPPPGPDYPIVGFYDLPLIGTFVARRSLAGVLGELPKADPSIPNVLEVPVERQHLKEWDDDDRKRLGLPADLLLGKPDSTQALLERLENLSNS